jgi:hypothetical protein
VTQVLSNIFARIAFSQQMVAIMTVLSNGSDFSVPAIDAGGNGKTYRKAKRSEKNSHVQNEKAPKSNRCSIRHQSN